MEFSITKISQNGQVVIPSEVRQNAGIEPFTKFLVFNKGGDIILKQLKKKKLNQVAKLIAGIEKSEENIKKGKCVLADSSMSEEDIDDLLLS